MIQNRYAVAGDIELIADLQLNGAAVPVTPAGCVVEARIAFPNKPTLAAGTSAVVCEKDGTITNRVIARFPKSMTGAIVPGTYEIEFVIKESGKEYPWERIAIFVGPRAAP